MKSLPAGTVKRIHVDRRVVAQNRKDGGQRPPWTIQTSKGPVKCFTWRLHGPIQGVGPDYPQLSCGARIYMVTYAQVEYR